MGNQRVRGVQVTDPGVSASVPLTGTITPPGVDIWISPTGDDTRGNGSLSAPWSFTALKKHFAVLGGKRIGLLPGTYRGGTDNGVFTSFYLFTT